MLKNYINADVLVDVLYGSFELGYTDTFVTSILNDNKDIIFELAEVNPTTIGMVPVAGSAAAIWNGKTGYISELSLYYNFQPPQYTRAIDATILRMELDSDIYLDVDTFSVNFNNGAISFSGNLI